MACPLLTKLTLLLVLVAMAEASSFWTSRKEWPNSRCEQVSHKQIEACRSYIRYGEPQVVMFGRNVQGPPRECCQQLKNFRRSCRCQAINEMMDVLTKDCGFQGIEERMEAERRAFSLPGTCGMEPSECQSSS